MSIRFTRLNRMIGICLMICCVFSPYGVLHADAQAAPVGETPSTDQGFSYRNGINWSMTPEQVLAAEGAEGLAPRETGEFSTYEFNSYTLPGKTAEDLPMVLGYVFRNHQLVRVMTYFITELTPNDIASIQANLRKQYGDPTLTDVDRWLAISNTEMLGFSELGISDFQGWTLSDGTLVAYAKMLSYHVVDYLNVPELIDHQAVYNQPDAKAPERWQLPQLLTLEDMAGILNCTSNSLTYVASDYTAADGSRLGAGYAPKKGKDAAAATIFVLADPHGGQARYDRLKSFAFLKRTIPVAGVGDEAVIISLRNMDNNPALYTTCLVRKGELILQVRLPYVREYGSQYISNKEETALKIAKTVLTNLYDTGRKLPSLKKIKLADILKRTKLNPGKGKSPVPDTLPKDLGGKTQYEYFVELRAQYLPVSVYGNPALSKSDLNNARRAARLLVTSISKQFDEVGQTPNELEIRAACYRFAYLDTGDQVFLKLAINDYKQAMSRGYLLGKADYEALATPLLAPMADLKVGYEGPYMRTLQYWLARVISVPYMSYIFDEPVKAYVVQFEKENGLTPDGIADIDFWLTLYAQIDDWEDSIIGE